MAANGFLDRKQASPLGLGAVVLLHGAVIAAVVLVKGPEWIRHVEPPINIVNVDPETPPPPDPPPVQQVEQRQTISRMDAPDQVIRPPIPDFVRPATPPTPPSQFAGNDVRPPVQAEQPRRLAEVPPRVVPRTPIRVAAIFDPRFAGRQQPPYPESEIRGEREGVVSVRITIGPDGRVVDIQRVSATSDAFWRATERHARGNWRFRPATEDGRAIQSVKTMSIRFRLNG